MIASALNVDILLPLIYGRNYKEIGYSPNESDVQWIEEEGNIVSVGDGRLLRLVIGLSDSVNDVNYEIPCIEERSWN